MTILTRIADQTIDPVSSATRNVLVVVAASILIALCAPISIPLPFTPVPLAIQAQVCLFLGALLGSKRGALAVLGFLAQGALGFPVFAKGASGIMHLFGPTGGYLIGYLVGAFVTGYLVERTKSERTMKTMFIAMAIGSMLVFALGWLQLSLFIGMSSAFTLGVLPFLIGDLLKLSLAGRLLKGLKVCR